MIVKNTETQVRPILVEHCVTCHGPEEQEGDFRLDHREAFQRGGGSGQVINKDKPGSSRLLKSVQYDDSDLQMPPDGKLPQEQIDVLQRWILDGPMARITRTEQVIRSHLPLKN